MALVSQSLATLRIAGDDLVPAQITQQLGCRPTYEQTKGEEIISKRTGEVRIAKFGMWRLVAQKRVPEDLDGQVSEILGKLISDPVVWGKINAQFKVDLFVGLFMKNSNEGLVISPKSLEALGLRGIKLGLDIYAPRENV